MYKTCVFMYIGYIVCLCVCMLMYLCTYVHICVCIYVSIYVVYIYIYTHLALFCVRACMRARITLKMGKPKALCPRAGQCVSCGLRRRCYTHCQHLGPC